MNQTEARAAWVAALRSGEYKQGRKCLRKDDRYCCLGVACELHRLHEGGPEWNLRAVGEHSSYKGETACLPVSVQRWLGVSTFWGRFAGTTLADVNDKGYPFSKIADLIETAPKDLFRQEYQ